MISYSVGMATAFGSREVSDALDALRKVSDESMKIVSYSRAFAEKSKEEGFPMEADAATQAPFDLLADFFRGTRGIMLDMYRRPDLLIKACETFLPFLIERAVRGAKASGNPRIFIPLHKGTDGSMSREHFLKFYWPTLRELMLALIEKGLCPCPFFEGEYASRLDIIKDIPAGKACYKFEMSDLAKAREVLGDGICLRGGIPRIAPRCGNSRRCQGVLQKGDRDRGQEGRLHHGRVFRTRRCEARKREGSLRRDPRIRRLAALLLATTHRFIS